jgi:hypothetical protein
VASGERRRTSVVMASTADCVSRHAQQSQNEADDHEDDPYGPQNCNTCDKPNDEQDDAEDDHLDPSHIRGIIGKTPRKTDIGAILIAPSVDVGPLAHQVDRT